MEKIDLVYNMLEQSIKNRQIFQAEVNQRLTHIEETIEEFKEFKGKLTGICIAISTLIGFIPWIFDKFK